MGWGRSRNEYSSHVYLVSNGSSLVIYIYTVSLHVDTTANYSVFVPEVFSILLFPSLLFHSLSASFVSTKNTPCIYALYVTLSPPSSYLLKLLKATEAGPGLIHISCRLCLAALLFRFHVYEIWVSNY